MAEYRGHGSLAEYEVTGVREAEDERMGGRVIKGKQAGERRKKI